MCLHLHAADVYIVFCLRCSEGAAACTRGKLSTILGRCVDIASEGAR